jgi:hypothetical protein
MRCSQPSVKTRTTIMYRVFILGAVFAVFILSACQNSQLTQSVQYRKYQSDSDVPRIPLADAKAAYDAGTAIIVDSRPEDAFKAEHIAKSINIPIGSTPDKFDALPKGKKIIVYCS